MIKCNYASKKHRIYSIIFLFVLFCTVPVALGWSRDDLPSAPSATAFTLRGGSGDPSTVNNWPGRGTYSSDIGSSISDLGSGHRLLRSWLIFIVGVENAEKYLAKWDEVRSSWDAMSVIERRDWLNNWRADLAHDAAEANVWGIYRDENGLPDNENINAAVDGFIDGMIAADVAEIEQKWDPISFEGFASGILSFFISM